MSGGKKQTGLYEPLPHSLGGQNEKPSAASIVSLLPFPHGAKIPSEEALNSSIRNRGMLLDADIKPSETEKKILKLRAKKRGRGPLGKLVIPKEEQKYELFIKLNELWKAYSIKALQGEPISNYGDKILRMDWHGAHVEVIRARDPGFVGVNGILIAETARTIIIVTKKDRTITVPKSVAVIRFMLPEASVELSLQALQFRASERSARKIKKRHFPYL